MKQLLVFVLLAVFNSAANAQLNLVPNSSFEDTVYCPFSLRQIDACEHWLNFGNSPDYFNACSNPAFAVPNSQFGYQYAHSGNAYAGAIFYRRPNTPVGPNYREYIGVKLLSKLVIGQKYYVSFFVVNGGLLNDAIANNKIGLKLYTVNFDSSSPPPLLNTSTLFTDSIIIDTLNWTKISGSFIADSTYEYLSIGNFFNDSFTDTIEILPFFTNGYYYIDDVCLSTDSIYNETWTGIHHQIKDEFVIYIYPNPSNGFLSVESPLRIDNYSIYNIQGQLINEVKVNKAFSFEINLSNNANGMYLLQIQSTKGISNHKIILTH
ncbi:MAG: T9SS type A sorting domain-containing protein [Bacteroidetes bacterium]|nr:T9SS type A sorting domain-containing protein [Bacteroidota bacterium]